MKAFGEFTLEIKSETEHVVTLTLLRGRHTLQSQAYQRAMFALGDGFNMVVSAMIGIPENKDAHYIVSEVNPITQNVEYVINKSIPFSILIIALRVGMMFATKVSGIPNQTVFTHHKRSIDALTIISPFSSEDAVDKSDYMLNGLMALEKMYSDLEKEETDVKVQN
jgi:hypothetical protein